MRETVSAGRNSAALREPNFGDLLGAPKRPRKPLEARRSLRGEREPAPRIGRMRIADILAGLVAAAAVMLVFVNALGMQRAPHHAAPAKPAAPKQNLVAPAPLPPARPEAQKRAGNLMLDLQNALAEKGYYDGAIDGIAGPRVIQAIRNFEKANGLKVTGEPNETILEKIRHSLTKSDITGSIAPAAPAPAPLRSRIGSVQRLLARYGFGPVRINGELDADTRAAIARFERERDLPASGEVSDRLVQELAAYSGTTPD